MWHYYTREDCPGSSDLLGRLEQSKMKPTGDYKGAGTMTSDAGKRQETYHDTTSGIGSKEALSSNFWSSEPQKFSLFPFQRMEVAEGSAQALIARAIMAGQHRYLW